MAASNSNSHRGWKICAAVTAILIIIVLVVLLVLFLTVLKLKQPDIVARPLNLESFRASFPAMDLDVTIGVLITVTNPNYGSFKYENSTAHISYHGRVIAEAPFKDGTIPSHKKHNITTSMEILASELMLDIHFVPEFLAGVLNFTSHTEVHGKGSFLKIFHKKVISYADCDITMTIKSENFDSVCTTKIKFL